MKRPFLLFVWLILIGLSTRSAPVDSLTYGPFGKVTIYHPVKTPEAVVLFVSGDGGWNTGVIEWAKKIAEQGALVVGIDIQKYFKKIKTEKVYPIRILLSSSLFFAMLLLLSIKGVYRFLA